MKTNLRTQLIGLLVLCVCPIFSQVDLTPERFAFEPDLPYNPDIPSPSQFLGYELGEFHTLYANVESYLKVLAEASDRILIRTYGETYEGRTLYALVITSASNHSRLEEIRQNNLKLTESEEISTEEAENLIESLPVFVSYSYNIHGNESSTTEAAIQVAYRLAAATDQETQNLLDNAVVIMYPCINPDGRDRAVYWYRIAHRKEVAKERTDLIHSEPWPNGRTNHYWFDLNRDWVWGVHPESRGETTEYQYWMPHLHADYHEQGSNSNYFTMPGTTPRNKLLPDRYEPLSDTIGMANVRAFDRYKINYFTREAFDFFYPSYGSSYPTVMGAIGMLTEQGSARGRAVETDDGYVLTLRQGIFDHYTTSIATIRKAVERKEDFIRYAYEAHQPNNSKSDVKTYIFPDNGNLYLPEVIRILLHHGVKVEKAEGSFSTQARSFLDGGIASREFEGGTYLVSTDQDRHLFINSVLEREMEIEDSVMYDMATWSAPLAYNLEAYSSTTKIGVSTSEVTQMPVIPTGLAKVSDPYAYLIEWKQRFAPKALAMLWEKGYRVRSVRKGFTTRDGEVFGPGSLVVLVGRNLEKGADIDSEMLDIALQAGVRIKATPTGRVAEGIDLASRDSRPIDQPRVALLVEPPFNTYTTGQIFYLFDQESDLPIERIRTTDFSPTNLSRLGLGGGADLEDYDVLILAGGGNALSGLFDSVAQKRLSAWVAGGGVLVATESAASFFTKKRSRVTSVELAEIPKDTTGSGHYIAYDKRTDYFGKKRIPGTALLGHIDNSNPLAFGLDKQLYTLKFGTNALKPNDNLQAVGYYEQDPERLLVAGYANLENRTHLAGKIFAAVQPIGQGKIVYLLDNTQYRMFWRGPSRMMQNAVMLLGGM